MKMISTVFFNYLKKIISQKYKKKFSGNANMIS